MEPSALHKHTPVYAEQDNCLYFALGLAKAAADFQRQAAAGPAQPPPGDTPAADDYLLFLLGLLAFARRYGRVLAAVQLPNPSQPEAEAQPAPVIRELLR